jgi:hypothetical protein
MDNVVEKLRVLVHDSLEKHLTSQAIYFATKWVSMTNSK